MRLQRYTELPTSTEEQGTIQGREKAKPNDAENSPTN